MTELAIAFGLGCLAGGAMAVWIVSLLAVAGKPEPYTATILADAFNAGYEAGKADAALPKTEGTTHAPGIDAAMKARG